MSASYQFSDSTMVTLRVVSSVMQFIGILVSLFRLWSRVRTQRLWWEDAWAFIACICAIILLASEWIYLKGGRIVSVVGFWIYALGLTCVIWAVRMSILFSVARIAHPTERMRRTVAGLATLFSLIFLTFMAMKVWWYAQDSSWAKESAFYTRPAHWLPYSMYVYELCTDCISDMILIFLPVRVLYRMNLPKKQRNMMIAIFSSSIIVTMVSILRAVSQMMRLKSLVGVATDFEVACSTVTCNLLVIATFVYRFARRASSSDVFESNSDGCDYTIYTRSTIATPAFTTVDLNVLDYSGGSQQSPPRIDDRSSSSPDP